MFIRIIFLFVLAILDIFLNFLSQKEHFKNNSALSQLDGIIYINLDKRTDRKEAITKELHQIFQDSKIPIKRLSATYIPKNGHKGCAHSHYSALKMAQELKWKNVLILEDDFHFTYPKETVQSKLSQLLNNLQEIPEWKVILLTGNAGKSEETDYYGLHRIVSGYLTTSAYIVNQHYYQTLIDLFYQAYTSMSSDKTSETNYESKAIDQQWAKLQNKENNWFIIDPYLGKQNDQLISTIQSETNYN